METILRKVYDSWNLNVAQILDQWAMYMLYEEGSDVENIR